MHPNTPPHTLPHNNSYAAHSGLAQIWTDYCRRVKQPVLAMREDGVRMADAGIAQVRESGDWEGGICIRRHRHLSLF